LPWISIDGFPTMRWGSENERSLPQTSKVTAVTPSDAADLLDEPRLVQRAKAGDRRALGTLLSHHGPRLYRAVLLPRLGNEARARDALSITYEKAIQHMPQYEWQPCGIYPWLRVIALRTALDMLRARRREVLFDPQDVSRELESAQASVSSSMPGLDAFHERDELDAVRAMLHDALARIHPRYATAIRLRILEDLPREQVAEQMGVTPATFDVLLHRSIASLKKVMDVRGTEGSEP